MYTIKKTINYIHMKQLFTLLSIFWSISYAQNTTAFSSKTKQSTNNSTPSTQYQTINGSHTPSNGILLSATGIQHPEWKIIEDKTSGLPIFIDGIKLANNNSTAKSSIAFIKNDVLAQIQSVLKIKNDAEEFINLHTETDAQQNQHLKLQQTKNGIIVYGAQAWLHWYANGEISFNGRTIATPDITDYTFVISQTQAETIAKSDISQKHTFTDNATNTTFKITPFVAEKIILPIENTNETKLAWHLTIRPDIMHRWEYFIDAKTGEILNKYDHTCAVGPATATATDLKGVSRTINTFNANSKYYMINATKSMFTGSNSTLPVEGTGAIFTMDLLNTKVSNPSYNYVTTTTNSGWPANAVSAHYNASVSFDYFKNKFGRNSIDGRGGDIISFVNVADDDGGGLDNAFWNGAYMFYGNGRTAFKPLARGLDVGGHEMTHGVVQNTANLEYQNESGAINESMADVFGVLIDEVGRTNYKIGVDVVQLSAFPSGALRDMQNPHNGGTSISSPGYQPERVSEKYTGTGDNGGVHINSGIPNKAFYLIATGITKAKAEQIYYKALSLYLTKSSKFIDLRIAIVRAATDLYGASSNEVTVVKQSFDAVEIFDGTGGNYQTNYPTNPGTENMLIVNTDAADNNTLYLTNSSASFFQPLSQVPVNRKASVTDDGTYAYFVGASDHNIYRVMLNSPYTQTKLTTDGFWDNIAVSKDGSKLAAISTQIDTSIYVFNLSDGNGYQFILYNPTTAQNVNSGGVLYADMIEWDYTGENILYDSYNEIRNNLGQNLSFWDIGIIKVWNKAANTPGSGTVMKLFSNLDVGESVGNPTFSKNSPYIISFDYINDNTNAVTIYGVNTETGDIGLVFNNGQTLGTPSYAPADTKIAFSTINTSSRPLIGLINLNSNKITSISTSATGIISEAKWPTWFAKGTRVTAVKNNKESIQFSLYPNPTNDKLFIDIKNNTITTAVIYNLSGAVMNANYSDDFKNIDVSNLAKGNYILHIITNDGEASKIFIKM